MGIERLLSLRLNVVKFVPPTIKKPYGKEVTWKGEDTSGWRVWMRFRVPTLQRDLPGAGQVTLVSNDDDRQVVVGPPGTETK